MNILIKKLYIKVYSSIIENNNNKKYMEELTGFHQFFSIYNDITNIKSNLNYIINNFIFSQTIII